MVHLEIWKHVNHRIDYNHNSDVINQIYKMLDIGIVCIMDILQQYLAVLFHFSVEMICCLRR